jgi:hypothetical protein
LEDLQQTYAPLPETPTALTGGGGEHRLFRSQEPLSSLKLAPGIDFLADSHHQFVAAPSMHHSGRQYTWEASSHPDDIPLAPLPDWLLALVKDKAKEYAAAAVTLPDNLPVVNIATLRVSNRIKKLIRTGEYAPRYPSRSEAEFAVLVALVGAGYDDATVAAIVLDPANGISDKPLSQKKLG